MVYNEDLYIKAKRLCLSTEVVLDQRLLGEKLTTSQCYLLSYIWNYHPKGTFATSLHKELGLSMATISGAMKRLRKKGYLAVEFCDCDERQKKLVPTDKLIEISQDLEKAIKATEESIYGRLSKQERKQLLNLEQKALEKSSNK